MKPGSKLTRTDHDLGSEKPNNQREELSGIERSFVRFRGGDYRSAGGDS